LTTVTRLSRGSERGVPLRRTGKIRLLPTLNMMHGSSRYFSPVPLRREISRSQYYGSAVHSLLTANWYPQAFKPVVDRILDSGFAKHKALNSKWDIPGRIGIIQEGGGKARVVAIPNLLTQMLMRPLHEMLMTWSKEWPESCLLNQSAGVTWALSKLRSGIEVISVDLTSATDRFPRDLQFSLLERIGFGLEARAFEEISSSEWYFPALKRNVVYEVGQPMGVMGSYPLFHISNIVLAWTAYSKAYGGFQPITFAGKLDLDPPFRVLGDDIIFCDRRVADAYVQLLMDIGVEVSPLKSFSKDVVQFAGFVILKQRKTNEFVAFRPYKLPSKGYISNPIEFLESLGKQATELFKSPKRRQFWEKAFDAFTLSSHFRSLDLTPNRWWDFVVNPEPKISLSPNVDSAWFHSLANKLVMVHPEGTYSRSALASLNARLFDRSEILDLNIKDPTRLLSPQDMRRFEINQRNARKGELRYEASKLGQDPLIKKFLNSGLDPLTSNLDDVISIAITPDKGSPPLPENTGRIGDRYVRVQDNQAVEQPRSDVGSKSDPKSGEVFPEPVQPLDMRAVFAAQGAAKLAARRAREQKQKDALKSVPPADPPRHKPGPTR